MHGHWSAYSTKQGPHKKGLHETKTSDSSVTFSACSVGLVTSEGHHIFTRQSLIRFKSGSELADWPLYQCKRSAKTNTKQYRTTYRRSTRVRRGQTAHTAVPLWSLWGWWLGSWPCTQSSVPLKTSRPVCLRALGMTRSCHPRAHQRSSNHGAPRSSHTPKHNDKNTRVMYNVYSMKNENEIFHYILHAAPSIKV